MSAARVSNKKASEVAGTRQRLMEAARAEFGEKGIEAATTRGIAERAGCNEVSLFRHFESKMKLLGAVVQDTSEEFMAVCERRGESSGNTREDLGHYARVYTDALERCDGMARAMIGESRRRPTLAKELIGDVLDPFHRSIADYLEKRQHDGWVRREVDPMAVAELFTSSLMGGWLRRTSGLSALDRTAWLDQTVEIFVRSIKS